MAEVVRLESDTAPGVATIRLDNGRMNPISNQVVAELGEVVAEVGESLAIGAVVVWGGPKIFAAGADINEFPAIESGSAAVEFSLNLHRVMSALENLPQITISAVNGFALGGGCELSMATDFRICGEAAVFGQPEVLLGILPGAGGTQRLMRLVGVTTAKEINYTGRQVKAPEALDIGLVSAIHPDDEVYAEAIKLAAGYAKGPKALRYIKSAMNEGQGLPMSEAVKIEAEAFGDCFETEDRVIGVQSFLEHGPGKATFTQR